MLLLVVLLDVILLLWLFLVGSLAVFGLLECLGLFWYFGFLFVVWIDFYLFYLIYGYWLTRLIVSWLSCWLINLLVLALVGGCELHLIDCWLSMCFELVAWCWFCYDCWVTVRFLLHVNSRADFVYLHCVVLCWLMFSVCLVCVLFGVFVVVLDFSFAFGLIWDMIVTLAVGLIVFVGLLCCGLFICLLDCFACGWFGWYWFALGGCLLDCWFGRFGYYVILVALLLR